MELMSQLVKWTLVGLFTVNALLTVKDVNRPRKPITPGIATIVVAIAALLVTGIIIYL